MIMDTAKIKKGENVLISPDLTGLINWTEGVIVEIKKNTFNGIVVAAETKDKNIFFGQKDLFKTINKEDLCLQ
jgi:predicted AlkP superfamily phosphohydrolase/phosphomutase